MTILHSGEIGRLDPKPTVDNDEFVLILDEENNIAIATKTAILAGGVGANDAVGVTAADTNPDFLQDKTAAGDGGAPAGRGRPRNGCLRRGSSGGGPPWGRAGRPGARPV